MEIITSVQLVKALNGQFYQCSCSYVSSTNIEDMHEDENTYFEFLHAVDTIIPECKDVTERSKGEYENGGLTD